MAYRSASTPGVGPRPIASPATVHVQATAAQTRRSVKFAGEEREDHVILAAAEPLVPVHAAQQAFTLEARFLGDAARRDVDGVGAKLEPRGAAYVKSPPREEPERPRHDTTAAGVAPHPIADLTGVARLVPPDPDRPEDAA